MMQPDEKYQIKSPADAANLVMMEMAFLPLYHTDSLLNSFVSLFYCFNLY
jgi:hypothetical protein